MEKRAPTYDLEGFRREFCAVRALRMTRTARDCAFELGLALSDVVEVVHVQRLQEHAGGAVSASDPCRRR